MPARLLIIVLDAQGAVLQTSRRLSSSLCALGEDDLSGRLEFVSHVHVLAGRPVASELLFPTPPPAPLHIDKSPHRLSGQLASATGAPKFCLSFYSFLLRMPCSPCTVGRVLKPYSRHAPSSPSRTAGCASGSRAPGSSLSAKRVAGGGAHVHTGSACALRVGGLQSFEV